MDPPPPLVPPPESGDGFGTFLNGSGAGLIFLVGRILVVLAQPMVLALFTSGDSTLVYKCSFFSFSDFSTQNH